MQWLDCHAFHLMSKGNPWWRFSQPDLFDLCPVTNLSGVYLPLDDVKDSNVAVICLPIAPHGHHDILGLQQPPHHIKNCGFAHTGHLWVTRGDTGVYAVEDSYHSAHKDSREDCLHSLDDISEKPSGGVSVFWPMKKSTASLNAIWKESVALSLHCCTVLHCLR